MRTGTNSGIAAGAQVKVRIALVGCNHRTAPVELRERVAFTAEQALDAADELRAKGVLEEAVVLSTCNRSELYGVPAEGDAGAAEAMQDFFTEYHGLGRAGGRGIDRAEWEGRLYRSAGPEAVRHLFRVAAGIDSMMLGEAEILGQLRAAYGQALDHGTTGPVLNRAFQSAIEVGKRVRAETEMGARPMSVALAGVKLAERVFGNLKGRAALIVGAGGVAEQVVEHLRNRGIGKLRVVNRSRERAEELARRIGGEAAAWESLETELGGPDVLVASVASEKPVVTRAMLGRAEEARAGRPMFIVDLGVPRNVEAEAASLYNVYLYNVDNLGEIVEQNKKAREAEIPRAEAIIAEQLGKFEVWRAGIESGSIAEDLRQHFHEQREMLLAEKLRQAPGLSAEERERLERVTGELIERVLAEPARQLRRAGTMRGRLGAIEALRHLFGIGESKK